MSESIDGWGPASPEEVLPVPPPTTEPDFLDEVSACFSKKIDTLERDGR